MARSYDFHHLRKQGTAQQDRPPRDNGADLVTLERQNGAMWIPRSAQELLDSLPDARETTYMEYKRELPARSKNYDIAIDITALSVDGGVLIYGVEEDKGTQTFTPYPIELAGQAERIDSVVRSYAGGELGFSVTTLPDADPANAGRGYIVVHVPESPLAPHVVEGYGMFGRGATGNRLLTQGDVDRLYARRRAWEVRAKDRIDAARQMSDLRALTSESPGVLRIVVSPLTSSTTIREQAGIGDQGGDLIQLSFDVRTTMTFVRDAPYDLSSLGRTHTTRTAHGVRLTSATPDLADLVEFEVQDNGTVVFAHGGIVDVNNPEGVRAVVDSSAAQMTAHVLAIAGAIYAKADYHGAVDVALSIDGGSGAVSHDWHIVGMSTPFARVRGVLRGDDIIESVRTVADQLVGAKAVDTARLLIDPVLRAVRNPGWRHPLEMI